MKDNLIFGFYPVLEALKSNKFIDRLFIQTGLQNEKIKDIIVNAKKLNVKVNYVPNEKLNKITQKNHQGIVAFISSVDLYSADELIPKLLEDNYKPLLLILDRITDVRNFGALVRTAECVGVDAIIIGNVSNAPINSDAMKTSAGALNYVPICKEVNLVHTIDFIQQQGITVIGATEKTQNSVYSQKYERPLAIVMGNEEDGISKDILKRLDAKVKLPLLGKTESLNVSVACGAILYEVIRQTTDNQ